MRFWPGFSRKPRRLAIIGVYPGAGKTTPRKALTAAPGNRIFHFDCDRFSKLSFSERESHIAPTLTTDTLDDAAENPLNWYAWEAIEAALDGIRTRGRFTYPHLRSALFHHLLGCPEPDLC